MSQTRRIKRDQDKRNKRVKEFQEAARVIALPDNLSTLNTILLAYKTVAEMTAIASTQLPAPQSKALIKIAQKNAVALEKIVVVDMELPHLQSKFKDIMLNFGEVSESLHEFYSNPMWFLKEQELQNNLNKDERE